MCGLRISHVNHLDEYIYLTLERAASTAGVLLIKPHEYPLNFARIKEEWEQGMHSSFVNDVFYRITSKPTVICGQIAKLMARVKEMAPRRSGQNVRPDVDPASALTVACSPRSGGSTVRGAPRSVATGRASSRSTASARKKAESADLGAVMDIDKPVDCDLPSIRNVDGTVAVVDCVRRYGHRYILPWTINHSLPFTHTLSPSSMASSWSVIPRVW